ncbi:MAG: hypothetical protein ACTH73_13585 [Glutamicibacter ardleyensis]
MRALLPWKLAKQLRATTDAHAGHVVLRYSIRESWWFMILFAG